MSSAMGLRWSMVFHWNGTGAEFAGWLTGCEGFAETTAAMLIEVEGRRTLSAPSPPARMLFSTN
jgi:hypothetical protein